jgi:hypothetical protein
MLKIWVVKKFLLVSIIMMRKENIGLSLKVRLCQYYYVGGWRYRFVSQKGEKGFKVSYTNAILETTALSKD